MRRMMTSQKAAGPAKLGYVSTRWEALSTAFADAVLGAASGALQRELLSIQKVKPVGR